MDDDIDDILHSIFEVIDLKDPRLKDKLRRGLEKGLEVASELGHDVQVELDIDSDVPDVVVLDGGRQDGAPTPQTSGPPDLSVIDGDGGHDDGFIDDDLLGEPVRVRVFGGTAPSSAGRIDVSGEHQTVFRGAAPRTYRIHCEGGGLEVLLDGLPADQMIGGQSIDVEASLVQVRGDGEGWYLALGR
ncbi:MAG: hypothetical protein H6737_15925 [Alphaproteobacteria bacterium]|nr:hypothetical protein [Alphaproteobacteria bacterium]